MSEAFRETSLLVDLQSKDAEEDIGSLSPEETVLISYLEAIERKQESATTRTITMNNNTTLVELFSITVNLHEAQNEKINIEKFYQSARKKLKKPSESFLTFENKKQKKILLVAEEIKKHLKNVADLVIARNLALNSDHSVDQAMEVLQWIKKTKKTFHENTVEAINKKSKPLLDYHYDVFYENFSQVKDARNRFKKLINENQIFITQKIKTINQTLIKKFGKNRRLHEILEEKLTPSIQELAKITATLQTILERLEERVKHQAAEEE